MKTSLLAAVLLASALPAFAQKDPPPAAKTEAKPAEPAAKTVAKPVCVGDCPTKDVDWIFYRYGTDCYGLDWHFLHAVAEAESGLDPKNHTGHYIGLFQMDTEACDDNIGTSKSYLKCSDLEDPEVNALVATNRFNRLFTGKSFFNTKSDFPGILTTCPNATASEAGSLAYIGHNNGPAVLKYVLKQKACTDTDIKAAITGFYEKNPQSRDDGKYLNDKKEEKDCVNAKEIKGKLSFRCVDAAWGIKKYEYGKDKIADKLKSLSGVYLAGAKLTTSCPIKAGKRVYTADELKKSLAGDSFK